MALEFKVLLLPRAYKDLEDICNYLYDKVSIK